MSRIDDLPPLREVIARHGLTATRALGQNFLLDLNLTSRIARTAGRLDDKTVIEAPGVQSYLPLPELKRTPTPPAGGQ